MSDLSIYIGDSKVLLPPVQEVLAGVLSRYPQVKGVEQWTETTDRTVPVLCLGQLPEVLPITYAKTLSQKQILANPAAITELDAALNNLLTPQVWEPLTYTVVDGLSDEEEKALGPILVVDIETGGDINTMLPEELWLLSVAIYDGNNIYVFTEESMQEDTADNAIDQLRRILTSGRKLIAANMKFDFRTLTEKMGVDIYGHFDTMLLHHAMNHGAKEHGLKATAQKYLGAPDWEGDVKQYVLGKKGYEAIPRPILYHYNAGDVLWTWRLYKYLVRAAEGDPRIAELAKREFRMSNFYQEIEKGGATVDLDHLAELKKEFEEELEGRLIELRDRAWSDFNPNSPQQVKRWFAERGEVLKSTGADKLEELVNNPQTNPRVVEFIELLLEYRGISKMLGTYVKGLLSRVHNGNKVYPSFLIHGTSTGRLASRNPNIQNTDRDKRLRAIYCASGPGRLILNTDYSQAELRVMAVLSGDKYLISLFQPGMPDFFDSLMPSAFPRVNMSNISDVERKEMRTKLKATIYGLAFNRKAAAIAKSLGMPVYEAQSIIDNFFLAAPQFYDWRMWVEQMALSPDETLISPYGRFYQAEVVTGRNRQSVINSGLAFLPQSTASDLCVDAAMNVNKWIGDYDARIFATVHDSIMSDVPEKHVREIAERAQWEMQEAARLKLGDVVPFAAEASWGLNWGIAD